MFPGPLVVGDPGDNTVLDLIGRTYAFLFCDDWTWYVLRWSDGTEIAPGLDSPGWETITDLLPPLPEFTGAERRFTAAFDQAARLNVAYEINGVIKVTRWSTTENAYLSNVEFDGHDPVLAFDATWALDVPNSDVLLFYLSTDRTRVMCRVQRDLYSIEYELHAYDHPVVLDRVTRLPLRFQALASDAVGEPLGSQPAAEYRDGLLSDPYPYLGQSDFVPSARLAETPYRWAVHVEYAEERLDVAAQVGNATYTATTVRVDAVEAPLSATGHVGNATYTEMLVRVDVSELMTASGAIVDDAIYTFTTAIQEAEDAMVAAGRLGDATYTEK